MSTRKSPRTPLADLTQARRKAGLVLPKAPPCKVVDNIYNTSWNELVTDSGTSIYFPKENSMCILEGTIVYVKPDYILCKVDQTLWETMANQEVQAVIKLQGSVFSGVEEMTTQYSEQDSTIRIKYKDMELEEGFRTCNVKVGVAYTYEGKVAISLSLVA